MINSVCLVLFAVLLVSLQTQNNNLFLIWGVFTFILYVFSDKRIKTVIVAQAVFGAGFSLYLYTLAHWIPQIQSTEMHVFLSRISLIFVLLPLWLLSFFLRRPLLNYWRKPAWEETMVFPFIWSGFHRVSIAYFLAIALAVNLAVFIPFIYMNDGAVFAEIWLLAIIFSVTNALLEELIWRGVLLSRFAEGRGEKWAVALTSVGFGLQHFSLGFSWPVCLAFSVGGLFFGGITVRSRSILPAMAWHLVLNLLMVLSGLVL
ncbi:CPBP family intramembrane metalloprotease [Planomicrobium chinense]|uniref:CPBP family intramembrane glutamic endopeptidase n=1 Tax=Planococcus chinensis TaxID=272917 RepID=UPI001CC6F8A5|nr:CPBP family intramembrane glutamic endopeptidase [Planococcus chinensis]MBZ5201974.1 CPBP family intramembrane metalloprotease [Planococcus chinensis]